MAITTDASIAQAKTTLLGQRLLSNLTHSNVLINFFQRDTNFVKDTGAYQLGQTISIPVVPAVTTNMVTATGGAVTYPKQTLTNVSLTLDTIASSPFSINDADLVLANINPSNDIIASAAKNHGNAIEKQLFLNTFNVAAIDGNAIGTTGNTLKYADILSIWQDMTEANVPETQTKVIILPPKMYADLLQDDTVSRLANPENSSTLKNAIILDTLGFVIIQSNACPTLTQLTNITGTSTNKVGFAFTTDSVVAAVRAMSTSDLGVRQVVVRNNQVNIATRFTESYNPDVIGGDKNYHMETLFGTKIYRPTTVFPILGGATA